MKKIITKQVENPYIYTLLKEYQIKNTPHIISVKDNTIEYEYIEGVDLALYQKSYSIDYKLCIHIVLSLITILENLQKYDIVHKGIKPQNIIINDKNEVFLIDFDASRYESEEKSKDTILMGTEGYASPEHYGYFATSYLSDIYSLGKTIETICANQFEEFNIIIEKMCQFDPKNRYQNYNEIRKAIKMYVIKKRKSKNVYTVDFLNIRYPISKTQIVISIIMIFIVLYSTSKRINTIDTLSEVMLYCYTIWVYLEIIDYIKLSSYLKKNPQLNKKEIFRKRRVFSFVIFFIVITLTIMLK